MARRNRWLRRRRWRAFFRVAGVWPWVFSAAVFACAALFVESRQSFRERTARTAASLRVEGAAPPAGEMTVENYRERLANGLSDAAVLLPRLLWAGMGLSLLAGGAVLGRMLLAGSRRLAPRTLAKRRAATEKPERPGPEPPHPAATETAAPRRSKASRHAEPPPEDEERFEGMF